MYNGQAEQDKFVLNILKQKTDGFFLEIGSNHPININNSFTLEKNYNWKGIMVEYEKSYLPLYQTVRPNSIHVIQDATQVDYLAVLDRLSPPNREMDYLQIDLEADNGSTIQTLEKLDAEVFDSYKFATITFEHDVYHTNKYNTRAKSREILKKRGYFCVFEDIHNITPDTVYEDWYVYPELVDMNYVNELVSKNVNRYVSNNITGKSINWKDIVY
jgi:hypothetical protein